MDLTIGNHVMLLWGEGSTEESLQRTFEELKKKVGDSGNILLENIERLSMSNLAPSSIDVVLSGISSSTPVIQHPTEILTQVLKFLKPNGVFVMRQPVVGIAGESKLRSLLTIAGFVNVEETKDVSQTDEDLSKLKTRLKIGDELTKVVEVKCTKPNYNVGSQAPLRLSFLQNSNVSKLNDDVSRVWSLSASDALEDDLIDEDQLLDEEDLKKPDQSTLKVVCDPSNKKKKACKNCSCGLADEQQTGKLPAVDTTKVTSSCGSCYLGDAFRCSSCPYMGLPAFKPGEKILLSGAQLQADV